MIRRHRIIPCLTLERGGLVRTVKFKDPRYVGDPINAVRIFNDKEVDELIVLDITPGDDWSDDKLRALEEIASEAFMPMVYGGQVRRFEQIRDVFSLGYEKVSLNTAAIEQPALVTRAAEHFGSQSVVVSMDVRRKLFGRMEVYSHLGRRATGLDPVAHARAVERAGAGELLVMAMDRDGTMKGYDVELVRKISDAVRIPVIAAGGAGQLGHVRDVLRDGHASAAAAGSMFVFQGKHRAVLITYPNPTQLDSLL